MKIIDGTNLVLGRLGTKISKYLLSGEQVVIINAEQVVIVGRADMVVKRYWNRRQRKDKANPENSMHWSTRPDLFVKRCMRGMLPYKRATGRKAYKLLKAYMGEPEQFKNAAKEDMSKISCMNVKSRYIYVGKICERLGYNKGV